MCIKIGVIGAKGFPGYGGAAGANEQLFKRISIHNKVFVYAMDSHAREENYHGMKQIIFKSYKNKKISVFIYYLKSLIHALFQENFDIIHLNHAVSGFLIPFLRLKYPVVLNIRGLPPKKDIKWSKYEQSIMWMFRKIGFKSASLIITVEKNSISFLKKFSNKEIVFIPNGVQNLKDFKIINNPKYDITFAAARIIELKGLHILLEALNNIKFSGTVQVIGDLDQVKSYKDKILKLSKNLNIQFKGLIVDKNELFHLVGNSKLFVFPSFTEGMSNMLLEVASIGVPIVASDIPQNIDVFSETEVIFFQSGNSLDLMNKISNILDNEISITRNSERAKEKVQKHHVWDEIALRYVNEYNKIINY